MIERIVDVSYFLLRITWNHSNRQLVFYAHAWHHRQILSASVSGDLEFPLYRNLFKLSPDNDVDICRSNDSYIVILN